jgi:hypothetical protein
MKSQRVKLLVAIAIVATISLLAVYINYLRENIASRGDHDTARQLNIEFNRGLQDMKTGANCTGLQSRYEVTKNIIYLHVHNFNNSCDASTVKRLAIESSMRISSSQRYRIEVIFERS